MRPARHLLPGRRLLCTVAAAGVVLVAPVAAGTGRDATADTAAIVHVLNRITFGPRPGDAERVSKMGLDAYVDEQLHPERIDDSALDARLAAFETLTMTSAELAERYFEPAMAARRTAKQASSTDDDKKDDRTPAERQALTAPRTVLSELTQARMLRATMSERQLQEVLTDFWLNHFNVFVGKGVVREYLTEYERDAIRPHVLGHFRDLLGAVAHSPAMLFYLDNWQSSTPAPSIDPQRANLLRRRAQGARLTPEQRERLETRLTAGGQAQRPARGINENYARELMELHTLGVDGGYTQDDVVALAKILTGWTIDRPRQGGAFVFRPAMHDTSTKTLLGVTFAPDGEREGQRALDLLARHPATAHHIAYQLAQRFVADEPPAALVDRAAKTFRDTDGDLREVVRAILTSPEFLASGARRAKVKTPLEFVASAVRATGATIESAQPLVAALQTLGMPLYGCQPPTGYGTRATDWVNTGALINRMNVAVRLVSSGPRAPVRVDVRALAPDTSAASQEALVASLLPGDVSDATRSALARADTPQHLIALALGSPEFQRK
jgi:uncharacterized protein (DUF1800 family)